MSQKRDQENKTTGKLEFNVVDSDPKKPRKPVYLTDGGSIRKILQEHSDNFVHPALKNIKYLSKPIRQVLEGSDNVATSQKHGDDDCGLEDSEEMSKYFDDLMRNLVKRESVAMTNATFQIDATRE